MNVKIPVTRLELSFTESGNVIGEITPKSRMERVMDEFRDWTEKDFRRVKKIQFQVAKKNPKLKPQHLRGLSKQRKSPRCPHSPNL